MAAEKPILLTADQVVIRSTLSKSQVYRLMKDEGFPRPLRVSHKCVRWIASEVDEWLRVWIQTLDRSSGAKSMRNGRSPVKAA